MSRQRNINPAPSAAPLFLTDATEPVHSLPLVHEHGGFQRVEDAGWKTEVASQEHFSSPPNKVLKKKEVLFTLKGMRGILKRWHFNTYRTCSVLSHRKNQ